MFSTPKCQTLYICNKCHQSVQNLTECRTRSSAVAVIADRLKKSLLRVFVLTLFIVIAASRPVNKNVSTGAVIWGKCGTEPGVHKLLANYQTAGTTFIPVHWPWEHNAERYSQTDGRTEYMMLSIACVAVRSAKKYHFKMLNVTAGYFP